MIRALLLATAVAGAFTVRRLWRSLGDAFAADAERASSVPPCRSLP